MGNYSDKNLQIFWKNSSFEFKTNISYYDNGDYEIECEEIILKKKFSFLIDVENVNSLTANCLFKVNRFTFYQFVIECFCKSKYDVIYDGGLKIELNVKNENIVLIFKNSYENSVDSYFITKNIDIQE